MKKLSRDGYTILKSDFNSKEIKKIKDDLTAKPYTMDDFSNGKEKKFYLYLESPKKLYVPRFYGLNRFGVPDIDKIMVSHLSLMNIYKYQLLTQSYIR